MFFFSSRRRHTRLQGDWSSDVCSSDLPCLTRAGLTIDEIARVKQGAGAKGWTEAEALLVKAADELHQDQFVSEATWTALRKHFTEKQCMDVVFTGAQYTLVSMILNSFGVQLDRGLPL